MTLSTLAVNTKADALAALLNEGALKIYEGPPSDRRLLAVLAFGKPAFSRSIGGTVTARPLTPADAARASGTATWFEAATADGRLVIEGSVGTSGADLVLSSQKIALGQTVVVSEFVLTEPTGDGDGE